MSYEPKEWVCGETITAEKLNRIENGIEEALECCSDKPLRVTFTFDEDSDTPLADKTFSEIYEAMTNGRLVYGILNDQGVRLDYYMLNFIDEELMASFIRTIVETQENDHLEAISGYFEITPENEVTYREVVLANY